MEDTRWLRLVTIGLVLAAMAVGYFLLAQRFSGTKTEVSDQPTPSPSVLGTDTTDATKSAYQRIAERTKGGVETLPATGFPALLTGTLFASAVIIGLGLRRFPN